MTYVSGTLGHVAWYFKHNGHVFEKRFCSTKSLTKTNVSYKINGGKLKDLTVDEIMFACLSIAKLKHVPYYSVFNLNIIFESKELPQKHHSLLQV